MCSLKRLNQQIWTVILLSIILMTPVTCGRLILENSYKDKEPSYSQIEQQQQGTYALNTKSILVQRLRPLVKRHIQEVTPLLPPCLLKLCMGK